MVDSSEQLSSTLIDFENNYLLNRSEVKKYRKLKKLSKYGIYSSVILLYFSLMLYFPEDTPLSSSRYLLLIAITVTTCFLTVIFTLNVRSFEYTEKDLVYHEVAAIIDSFRKCPEPEPISEQLTRFKEKVLESDNDVLPENMEEEISEYLEYINRSDMDIVDKTLEPVLLDVVSVLTNIDKMNLESHYPEPEEKRDIQAVNEEPSIIVLILDSLNTDYLSESAAAWMVFITAVVAALILSYMYGQEWGVLLVTIVFAGLRLRERYGE